ncbi:MAG TPA: FAD-binding oxidoreductase [Hyphomicrobiales bacterium]|nr:FAD-binding oxidoreductase [Hyphomicrobiales bacterium]
MDARSDPLLDRLAAIVGARNVLTDPAETRPYLVEPRDLFVGVARAVVRPGTTQEVAAIVRLAGETTTPILPQGGNTGLVGGNVPDQSGRMVVVSLQRMNRIRAVDAAGDTMTAEAGVTLAAAQEAAAAADRLFPLSLASEGTCTIGGNLSTNAGGTAVLAYGSARDLALGLEVVLPDGRIWNGLGRLRKDNTGYDLKSLFVGAEGTLGIITAAVLKLFPRPRASETALVGVPSPEAALALFRRARAAAGPALTTIELMPRIGIEFVLRHVPTARDPLATPHRWYVMIELTSPVAVGLDTTLAAILEGAIEAGEAEDATVAASLEQRNAIWLLREAISDMQKPEGGSIKHDISVPVAAVPELIARASAAADRLIPGIRPVPFGHLGDGNIHLNFSQPLGADKASYLARWDELNAVVHAITAELGGSISAEHGIGRLKRDLLPGVKDPVALDLMRTLKAALDPKGLMNPGAVLAE